MSAGLLVTGLNHKTAPVELREQLAASSEVICASLPGMVRELRLREAMIVSTCNRVEVYAVGEDVWHQSGARVIDYLARLREVKPDELRGGTFTITNAGNIGGILATPIINFPEVAILGVHRIVKRPGVVETPEGDKIEVRQYMNLSISVDHRLADGADGARFLVHMKRLLENPGLLAL